MGRLAAAFERDALHVAFAGVDHHQLADLGRAGEGDHVDVRMERERLAGPLAETRHDVEHAVGQARLLRQPAERERGERRLLGGLQDHRIAGDQRRADLPGGNDQRIVPRHDRADDAERLLPHHRDVVGAERARPRRRACRPARRSTGCSWRRRGRRHSGVLAITLPTSSVSSRASSSPFSRMSSAKRSSTAFFRCGSASRQTPASNAARAALTARSTSAAPQSATSANALPSIGEILAKVAPSSAATYAPPMKARPSILSAAARALQPSRVDGAVEHESGDPDGCRGVDHGTIARKETDILLMLECLQGMEPRACGASSCARELRAYA